MEYTLKDSGVEWLGEIPEHWEVDRIKDLSKLRNKKISIKSDVQDYLELEDLSQWTGEILSKRSTEEVESSVTLFNKGDVLFGKLRPYLAKYALADFDGKCTGEILAIKPERIHGSFFKYYIGSPHFIYRCDVFAYGAKMPRVSWLKQMGVFEVTVPPRKEQIAIADYLDKATQAIDDAIATKKKQLTTLGKYRKSLIHEKVTKGLTPNPALKDSGVEWLGEIPEHWKVKYLKRETLSIETGKTPDTNTDDYYTDENGIRWIGPECFSFKKTLEGQKGFVSNRAVQEGKAKLYSENSVYFVGIGATAGKVGLPREVCSANQQINVITPRESLDRNYLYYQLKILETEVSKFAQYTTLPILNQTRTGYISIVTPSTDEQISIADYLDKATAKIDETRKNLEDQIDTLKDYRKSLIHEVVTGRKRVYFGEVEE